MRPLRSSKVLLMAGQAGYQRPANGYAAKPIDIVAVLTGRSDVSVSADRAGGKFSPMDTGGSSHRGR